MKTHLALISVNPNIIQNAGSAISLDSSYSNTLTNNTLTHNFYNFKVTGTQLSSFINYIDSSNTIDGKQISYLIGNANQIVPSESACVVLVNCVNMTIQNTVLALSSNAVILVNTTGSTVDGCKLGFVDPSFLFGIFNICASLNILIYKSANNKLTDNQAAIWLNYSSSNILTENTAAVNLYGSNNNEITENRLEATGYDAVDWSGVCLQDSSNNIINENTIYKASAQAYRLLTDQAIIP